MGKLNMKDDLLNEILDNLKIDNAFENWKDYRNTVTGEIISKTEKGKTLAIWGAGRCNDLDLLKLSLHFSKVFLIDIDEEAMKDAVKRYDLENNENIIIVVKDFLGLTKEDYSNYIEIAMKDLKRQKNLFTPFATAPKLIKELDVLYTKVRNYQIDFGKDLYDYSVALGVHSQLNSMPEHIWRQFLFATGKNDVSVAKRVHKENQFISEKFNEGIINATKKQIFVGLEKCEFGLSSSIEGVIQAKADFRIRCDKNELLINDIREIIWPFNPNIGKKYLMELMNIEIIHNK